MPRPPLKFIEEELPAQDDIRSHPATKEDSLRNLLETFPLFPAEDGPRGPKFIEQDHRSKLAFFGTIPYEGERIALSFRFRMKEHAIYYARILYYKNRIFKHKVLDFVEIEQIPCFHQTIERIEQAFLKGFPYFNHGWNREIILQFYATLYISGDEGEMQTWLLEWMTEEDKISCSADKFSRI